MQGAVIKAPWFSACSPLMHDACVAEENGAMTHHEGMSRPQPSSRFMST